MSTETQIRALAGQGMPAEDISRELGVELTAVKIFMDEEDEAFSKEEKRSARKVIAEISKGGLTIMGDPIPAVVQLKAAMYVHSGGNVTGTPNGLNIHALQQMILASRQSATQKMVTVLGNSVTVDAQPIDKPGPSVEIDNSARHPQQISPGPASENTHLALSAPELTPA